MTTKIMYNYLSANKPLIYFDSKIINPLIDDAVRRKIQKAVFYINIDNNSWKNILMEILNRPYEAILKDWEVMRVERKKFISEYIFSEDINPGTKVATYINNLITIFCVLARQKQIISFFLSLFFYSTLVFH